MKRIFQYTLLIAGILAYNAAYGQAWQALGPSLPAKPSAYTLFANDRLLVAYTQSAGNGTADSIVFTQWDGSTWRQQSFFVIFNSSGIYAPQAEKPRIIDMAWMNGSLFAIMRLPQYDNSVMTGFDYQLMRYEEGKWIKSAAINHVNGSGLLKFLYFRNQLYLAGDFSAIDTLFTGHLARWNGQSWEAPYRSTDALEGNITDAIAGEEAIYFSFLDNHQNARLMRWNGDDFTNIPAPSFLAITNMVYLDKLCLYGYDRQGKGYKVFEQSGSGWKNMLGKELTRFILNAGSDRGWIAFNNSILAAGHFATDSTSGNLIRYIDGHWHILKTDNLIADSLFLAPHIVYGFTSDHYVTDMAWHYGKISGYLYKDKNNNCQFDQGDEPLPNHILSFSSDAHYTATDSTGHYEIFLPAGDYTLRPMVLKWYMPSACSPPSFDARMFTNSNTIINVGYIPDAPVEDLSIKIIGATSGMRARHGYIESYLIKCTNVGTKTIDKASVILHFPSTLNLISSKPGVSILSPATLGWNVKDLSPGTSFPIRLQLEIATQNEIGSVLKFTAQAVCGEDADAKNNEDSLLQTITAALDPNDKQCSQDSTFTKTVDKLKYEIRFQNIGTDTAQNVIVRDTIDTHIPIDKIDIDGWSHPYSLAIEGADVLVFHFNHINLPPRESNPAASQGYVHYTISLSPDMPVGSIIKNAADIYFDYQPPVRTNTTICRLIDYDNGSNSIESTLLAGHSLSVYPNPATHTIEIRFTNPKPHREIIISNILGERCYATGTSDKQLIVDISALPAGIYYIHDNVSGQYTKLIINY